MGTISRAGSASPETSPEEEGKTGWPWRQGHGSQALASGEGTERLSSLPHVAQSDEMELHSRLSHQTPKPTFSTLVRSPPPSGRCGNQELDGENEPVTHRSGITLLRLSPFICHLRAQLGCRPGNIQGPSQPHPPLIPIHLLKFRILGPTHDIRTSLCWLWTWRGEMGLKSSTQHSVFSKRTPLMCVLVLLHRKPCMLMSFLKQQAGIV